MKIYFSPEYSGTVYARPEDGKKVMMDTIVLNTIGLLDLLELRLGIHNENLPEGIRIAHYYKGLCKYMTANPVNVLSDSFKIDGLHVAMAMLSWRDELRRSGWEFKGEEISDRLRVLIEAESYLGNEIKNDTTSRLNVVIKQIPEQSFNGGDLSIVLPFDRDLLPPMEQLLLEAVEKAGAKISLQIFPELNETNLDKVREMILGGESEGHGEKVLLSKNDESILVYKFPDEWAACEYFSFTDQKDIDVWINPENHLMDNWLWLMGKEQSGSMTEECLPPLTQLLSLGIGLFHTPLNINTLVAWLSLPIHPLGHWFCKKLAAKVIREGGYQNDTCRDEIKKYLDGEYVYLDEEQKKLPEDEQLKIREKGKKDRQKKVDMFLPSEDASLSIKVEKIRNFVKELKSWTSGLFAMRAQPERQIIEQLQVVIGMCEAFLILLDSVQTETIDSKTLNSFLVVVYRKKKYTNAIAEKGCRNTIDSSEKIVSIADSVVWIGVDGDDSYKQGCDFLLPSEKEELIQKDYISLWDKEKESRYYESLMLTPLRMTSRQLILVERERVAGEPTLKHPLVVRLEHQIENFDEIVRTPQIDDSYMQDVSVVSRTTTMPELSFDHSDKIKWPDHLSPTSIDNLVQNPFDYLMGDLLKIKDADELKPDELKTTYGTVAHAVIEALFAPRDGRTESTPAEIEERIKKEFEEKYDQTILAKGLLLLQTENALDERGFHDKLKKSIEMLLEILRDNNLSVESCEYTVKGDFHLGLPDEGKGRDIEGRIDLVLKDSSARCVVFDIKWTLSKNYYIDILKKDRSIQLELYRRLLSMGRGINVEKVAYFIMPLGILYSKEYFKGSQCVQVTTDATNDVVGQVLSSINYRKEQIAGGTVEMSGPMVNLQYVQDTENKKLFPLKMDTKKKMMKEENKVSDYKLFINLK